MTDHPQPQAKTEREAIEHRVKCAQRFFGDVWSGRKTFEVRLNDRDYREGDTLVQEEWDAVDGYSGRQTRHGIGYVLEGFPGLAPNHVAFALLPSPGEAMAGAIEAAFLDGYGEGHLEGRVGSKFAPAEAWRRSDKAALTASPAQPQSEGK